MGNTESTQWNPDQLNSTLARDNLLYEITCEEEKLFNDDFLAQKFLQELENTTSKYKEEDELLKREGKRHEKGRNLNFALGVVTSGEANASFRHKQLNWLKREINNLAQSPYPSFAAMLEKRLLLLRQIHSALLRYDQRKKVRIQFVCVQY